MLFTVGGEAFGLLPFGELARAELASEATGAPIGTTMAAVTVQELLYTTVIVAVAIPGALAYAAGISGIAVSLAGIVAIIGILTIDPVFSAVLRVVGLIPWARRARRSSRCCTSRWSRLMRRPQTWLWLILSVLGALFELTLFWLMVRGTSGTAIPWVTTTFIYGAAYLAGAATSPGGGVGGFETTAIALLQTQGVLGPAAVAAALLQRAADKGVITLAGFAAWFWVQRHIRVRRGLRSATARRSPGTTSGLPPLPVPAAAAALPREPVARHPPRRAPPSRSRYPLRRWQRSGDPWSPRSQPYRRRWSRSRPARRAPHALRQADRPQRASAFRTFKPEGRRRTGGRVVAGPAQRAQTEPRCLAGGKCGAGDETGPEPLPGAAGELGGDGQEELVHPPAGEELPEELGAALAEDGDGRQVGAHRLDHRAGGDLTRPARDRDRNPRVHRGELGCPSSVVMTRTSPSGWRSAGWAAGRSPLPVTTASGGGPSAPVSRRRWAVSSSARSGIGVLGVHWWWGSSRRVPAPIRTQSAAERSRAIRKRSAGLWRLTAMAPSPPPSPKAVTPSAVTTKFATRRGVPSRTRRGPPYRRRSGSSGGGPSASRATSNRSVSAKRVRASAVIPEGRRGAGGGGSSRNWDNGPLGLVRRVPVLPSRRSSVVEQRFRKPLAGSSNLPVGSRFRSQGCLRDGRGAGGEAGIPGGHRPWDSAWCDPGLAWTLALQRSRPGGGNLQGDMNVVLSLLPTVVLVAAIGLVVMLVRYFLKGGPGRLW